MSRLRFSLLLERALGGLITESHKFSSTHIQVEGDLAKKLREFGMAIPDGSLADKGRESDCHTTVKYGLHTSDADDVREVIAGIKPFKITLGKMSIFSPDESGKDGFEVLKIDVTSEALHRLNQRISDKLECTDTHPTYKPHLTIAYLKPGKSRPYVGDDTFAGTTVLVRSIVFSPKDGDRSIIDLDA